MERFGVALKRARVARKMTQAQLGELSGIGRTHVNRIETGETYRPTDETIDKLAAALDMTTDDLLANVEPPLMLREDRGAYVTDLEDDDLLQVYSRMRDADRKRLVAIARAIGCRNAGSTPAVPANDKRRSAMLRRFLMGTIADFATIELFGNSE